MNLKSIIEKVALLAGSLLFCFVIFEFVVFKYILNTSDNLPNTSINNIVRFEPNTNARLYEPDGSSHTIEINAQGWNSTKKSYKEEKTEGTLRIAVIGDSYVQASAVNTSEAFAEVIEQELNKQGHKSEVYRFGIDGAPHTQYLYMLRNEVLKYKPEIVVVQLIHNDFDESYRFLYGRYSSSFMKVNLEGDKIKEVNPEPYKPGWVDSFKNYRTFRFIYYQTGLSLYVRRLINLTKDEEVKETKAPKHGFIQSAIDVRNIGELEKIKKATLYSLNEMKKLSESHRFKLLVTMDPVREAIYSGTPAEEYEANQLNIIAKEATDKLNISFLDLKNAMTKHYKTNNKKFEFPWDWHWNKLGNEVVGKAIAKDIELRFLK